MTDLRYGLRSLRRAPAFSAIAVFSLAIGIGGATAVFSVLDPLLLRGLPVADPASLVRVIRTDARGISLPIAAALFEQLRAHQAFAGVFATVRRGRVAVALDGAAEPPSNGVRFVSRDFFLVLGIGPALEDRTAVLSYRYWQGRFGASPAALGKTIVLGGVPFTIAGIAPRRFTGLAAGETTDLWAAASRPLAGPLSVFARLKPGLTLAQARARTPFLLEPAGQGASRLSLMLEKPLLILLAATGLLLLIGCANVAILMLARAATRQKELAIRAALGAGRCRLARQLLTEALLVAGAAGAAGVALAFLGHRLLIALLSLDFQFSPDPRLLAFAAGVSLLAAVLFALIPALTPRLDLPRGVAPRSGRAARVFVAAQTSLCLALLSGAGLFLRTLRNLDAVPAGFEEDRILLFRADPSLAGYRNGGLAGFYAQLVERLGALPGVRAASVSSNSLLSGVGGLEDIMVEGRPRQADDERSTWRNLVGPGFFRTMGMSLLLGRDFTLRDDGRSPRVAVVNEAMARHYFNGASPLGRRFGLGGPETQRDIEIVGVVRDAQDYSLRGPTPPVVYLPYLQSPDVAEMAVEVRAASEPAALVPAIRREMAALDRRIAPFAFKTQATQRRESLARERSVAVLASLFGGLALLLAAAGLYGVMSTAVARRTAEIGVRMALGAEPRAVLRQVVSEAIGLMAAGASVGLLLALMTGRLLVSLLFGVHPLDPFTLAASTSVLAAVGTLAAWLPAHRAARIDPVSALRHE